MSDSLASLRRKIDSAQDLQSVVRTMKALAASSIGQYERSVHALADYWRTVELGLSACFRESAPGASRVPQEREPEPETQAIDAVVFGSDQGLVGRFNEVVADHAIMTLAGMHGKLQVWAVGERVHARLTDAGLPMAGLFPVPTSVKAIAPLVSRIQIASLPQQTKGTYGRVHVFHNRPSSGALYEPADQRVLPLDAEWQRGLSRVAWPTRNPPQIMGNGRETLGALVREYLFLSLFRACAQSLASENASRLAAMQRADKNIDTLLEHLHGTFHRLRQQGIDEELFDVISGYDALAKEPTPTHASSLRRRTSP